MNLQGLTVLNTRPREQAIELHEAIFHTQGRSILLPVLDIQPVESAWWQALPAVTEIHQAIFTSANAVKYFFVALKQQNYAWTNSIIITAIGNGTAKALLHNSIHVHHLPIQADSEHILALENFANIKNQCIILVKGEEGRNLIAPGLRDRDAALIELSVYKRCLPIYKPEELEHVWRYSGVDIILFTSHQAMQHSFQLFPQRAHSWLQQTPWLVIGPRLADEAQKMGAKNIISCQPERILETLEQFKQGLFDEPK